MAIDRRKAAEAFHSIALAANEEGAIPRFGAMLFVQPAGFWNSFTEKLLKAASPHEIQAVETVLESAAAEYGYHLAHEVMESPEFQDAMRASAQNGPEDLLNGFFSLLAAWGWADAEVVFLDPAVKMVVHAHSYYEAEIRDTFPTGRPLAFMLGGICRALMDLTFGASYPDGLSTFACRQTRAMELGDPYGEFVVTRTDSTS
jgi:hypothetical protein